MVPSATARAAHRGTPESERAAAVKAARSASAKAQESLREFAKGAGEAEKALGSSCSLGTRQQEKQAGCWRKGTLCRGGDGEAWAIEEVRLGRRVCTLPQEERAGAMAPRLEIDPALWREVFLVQDDVDNGGVLSMALLRPLAWLNEHKVEVGAWVPIDLPEMGVQGEALVTAVQPCPDIEEGEGCLVTGTFRRSKALVMELKVAGESEVLGVAGNHLVWSEDRQDWVAVKDLEIGERLRARNGSTPDVESLTACQEPEPVYNLEVESDHCYRVGQQGLLVHNASNPCVSMMAGFANRQVNAKTTITVNVPAATPPAGHTGPWHPAPAVTYALTIPDTVIVKLERPLSSGTKPDREIKWAITDTRNPDRIGYVDPTNQPKSDAVGHIVDRKFGGNARHNDDGNRNVFAQNSSLNDTDWNQFMALVEQTLAIPAVCSVCLKFKFNYLSSMYPDRPSTVRIEWWVDAPAGTMVPLGSLEGKTTISNRIGG